MIGKGKSPKRKYYWTTEILFVEIIRQ